MNILITGGAGFIGSHLVDYFMAKGDSVIVFDNLLTGEYKNIAHHIGKHNFTFLQSDVCEFALDGVDLKDLAPDFRCIDLIYHLACPASPQDYLKYPIKTMKTMSIGTYNMLEYARRSGAKFILASSSEVYGDPVVHPQREDYTGNVNTMNDRAVYDEGKRFAETLTRSYFEEFNLKIGIARIFNTYGPRMRKDDGRVIPNFINQALTKKEFTVYGNGHQTRSFCYIDDMIEALVKMSEVNCFRPINIGNPEEHSIIELSEIISDIVGVQPGYNFSVGMLGDPTRRSPYIYLAENILEWKPKISLREGIIKMLEAMKHDNT